MSWTFLLTSNLTSDFLRSALAAADKPENMVMVVDSARARTVGSGSPSSGKSRGVNGRKGAVGVPSELILMAARNRRACNDREVQLKRKSCWKWVALTCSRAFGLLLWNA